MALEGREQDAMSSPPWDFQSPPPSAALRSWRSSIPCSQLRLADALGFTRRTVVRSGGVEGASADVAGVACLADWEPSHACSAGGQHAVNPLFDSDPCP